MRPLNKLSPLVLLSFLLFTLPNIAKCEEFSRRGLFVTVVQEPPVLSNRKDIGKLIDFAKRYHINTLFIQIYRANQAWFPSRIADQTPYETCLKTVSEDPLRLLIKEAQRSGIEVHAWLNMLSLGDNKDARILKKYGAGILTKNLKEKKSIEEYKIDEQYFLEPGDYRVRQYLVDIVGEILTAYPELDGIQFDYIRYPDKNPAYGYTKENIKRFKMATGLESINEKSRAWKDWKLAQVTGFLEMLVKKTRSLRPNIRISATGCMPYSRAYLEAFQDWPSWLKGGLVDFITIMSYSPDLPEFEEWVRSAKREAGDLKKVNIAIGAYKLAGRPAVFKEELNFSERTLSHACVIFHYGSLLQNPLLVHFLASREKLHDGHQKF